MDTMRKVTPDGRYFVVKGRLWRMSDPKLTEAEQRKLKTKLGRARARVRLAQLDGDASEVQTLRAEIDAIKRALGERGQVWWIDGAPDYNRQIIANTPYAAWWAKTRPRLLAKDLDIGEQEARDSRRPRAEADTQDL